MTPDPKLTAALARERARIASEAVRQCRELLGKLMLFEREAEQAAREAERVANG